MRTPAVILLSAFVFQFLLVNVACECVYSGTTYQTGQSFNSSDGCNTCSCSSTGIAVCTRTVCITCDYSGITYQAGQSFNSSDGCNTCSCSSTGIAACTRKACITCDYSGITYQPGQSFNSVDGCNTCFCSDTGIIGCTLKACIPKPYCPARSTDGICDTPCGAEEQCADNKVCCPGTTGQCSGCVDSVCNVDGSTYQLGDSFPDRDGCNNCTCVANGRAICTLVACQDPCYDTPDRASGSCPLNNTRYYYDATSSICRSYYRSCNARSRNDFDTPRACYQRCNAQSVCTAEIYPPNPPPATCLRIGRKWTFDNIKGNCIEFGYRGCNQQEGYNVFPTPQSCSDACVAPPTVPTDCTFQALVFCFAPPCDQNTCPAYPSAVCKPNFCGGCNAHFFNDGKNVTDRCNDVQGRCDDGSVPVQCFSDPCRGKTCSAVPSARCVADYCGGCYFKYIDGDGMDVTNQCEQTGLLMAVKQPVCPNIDPDLPSICTTDCEGDSDCETGELCCSRSCGSVCTPAEFVRYYAAPRDCPSSAMPRQSDICPLSDASCMNNSDCTGSQLCCRSRCGRTCQNSITSTPACSAVIQSISGIAKPPGYYTPTCQADGTYSPVQCHASTGLCWCVDISTGKAVSSYYPRGVTPNCSGAGPNPGCNYNGMTYVTGQSFTSIDGCNTCSCLEKGGVACTRRACGPDVCSLEPLTGRCRANIPSYHYNMTSGKCERFTYGGCGGNGNKFGTINDCLQACDPGSVCLKRKDTGRCRARNPRFFFNTATDMCETFVYGGCNGNENRFSSIRACSETCAPHMENIRCPSSTACTLQGCTDGNELVRDDRFCCPYCRPTGPRCMANEHRCSNGKCIKSNRLCDGLGDCSDEGDERGCTQECEFRCSDGTCIPRSNVCDTVLDCRDGSDIRNCSTTFSNVYYLTFRDIPLTCPAVGDTFGVCSSNCRSKSDCADGEECCTNGCGAKTCMSGVRPTPLCHSIRRNSEARGLLGRFSPMCQSDGNFMEVQCHERYCWCVDIITGQPVSEGTTGRMPQCGGMKCKGVGGQMIGRGESQRSADGCNTCICIGGGRMACTRRACPAAPCQVGTMTIPSGTTLVDKCNTCRCRAGALLCTRKACVGSAKALQAIKKRYQTSIPFSGDFSKIEKDMEEFKRHIVRSFLEFYEVALGLLQEQVSEVQVKRGSIIVVLTLVDSNGGTEGANATILVGQIAQDFDNNVLIIRYNGQVLEPSGVIQTIDLDDDSGDNNSGGGLKSWHIAIIIIIVIIALLLSVVAIAVIAILVVKRRSNTDSTPTTTGDKAQLDAYELKH